MPSQTTKRRRQFLAALVAYPAMVAAARWSLPNRSARNNSRKVIISSDDAGMCAAVNEGTIQSMTRGIVTSASILTCCPAFDEFAEFAISNPQYDYGVHLTLTCDLPEQPWGPVSNKKDVPSLVDQRGLFPHWPSEVNLPEAELELKAQIAKALDAGIRITHLDHHMWVMFHSPELLRLYVRLGEEYQLPIRFSRVIPQQITQLGETMVSEYQSLLNRMVSNDFPVLEFVESDNYSTPQTEKRAYHLHAFRALPSGISEIAAHCAVMGYPINPPDVEKRAGDLEFLTSLEAAECLEQSEIGIISWKDFANNRESFGL